MTRQDALNKIVRYYGLEHPVTLKAFALDEEHPTGDEYTEQIMQMYVKGFFEEEEEEEG